MNGRYVLDGKDVKECPSLLEWAEWFENADRRVAKDTIDDCDVSTVFLGLDHRFRDGPPLLFETMVFGGDLDQEMDRYSTWDEAVEGHAKMVQRVKGKV